MGVSRLYDLRHRAKRRGIPCTLTPDDWLAFEESVRGGGPCHLCRSLLRGFRYLRLLPVNRETGYTADTVKAICGRCAADVHRPAAGAYTPPGATRSQQAEPGEAPRLFGQENGKTRFSERDVAFQERIARAQAAFLAARGTA